jgi:hypothetical protein
MKNQIIQCSFHLNIVTEWVNMAMYRLSAFSNAQTDHFQQRPDEKVFRQDNFTSMLRKYLKQAGRNIKFLAFEFADFPLAWLCSVLKHPFVSVYNFSSQQMIIRISTSRMRIFYYQGLTYLRRYVACTNHGCLLKVMMSSHFL